MGCGNFSASTTCLKVATVFLIIVFILHIAGVAVPRWASLTLSADVYGIGVDVSYHAGLWKDCVCTSLLGSETCSCNAKVFIPEWLKAVRGVEAMGLIGFIISMIMTIVILFSRQDKTVRGINIVMVGGSGLLIIIGVIIFGIENTEDFEELFSFIDSLPINFDTHGSLAAAFILSTIAGVLCLAVCLPLLIKDYLTPIPPQTMQVNPMSVQYTNQGHVVVPPPGQMNVVIGTTTVQQPMGYMQPGPATYAPMGQPMQPAPAYTGQAQPQYPQQQQDGYPYKS